jgi:serine/threonine-protein kinase
MARPAHGLRKTRRRRAPSRINGRYRLDRELAVGGTARVWIGIDERLLRPVAVKLLHPHLLPDRTSRQRLVAEARAAAGLRHPGIAAIYDVSARGSSPAIVMELVDGEPLDARLRHAGALPADEAARLVAEVAESLYHAHQHGIVHRDVKPGNVLVERGTGRARLIDFGIAHSLAISEGAMTQTGTVPGTPRYMAPEQLAGEAITPRTDLWGLGCLLAEALSGIPPFDGPSPVAIARQHGDGPRLPDAADEALATVARACLQPHVDDRPRHARVVALALRAWLAGERDLSAMTAHLAAGGSPPGMRPLAPSPDQAETLPAVPVSRPAPGTARRSGWRRWRVPVLPQRRSWAGAVLAAMLVVGVAAGIALRPAEPAAGDTAPEQRAVPAATVAPADATPDPTAQAGDQEQRGNGRGNGGDDEEGNGRGKKGGGRD